MRNKNMNEPINSQSCKTRVSKSALLKQTFYFYILHDCEKYSSITNKEEDFDYLSSVKKAIESASGKSLILANDIREHIAKRREEYELDNGIDVRDLQFTGEIKEITKESYEIILADDVRILEKMSDKSKKLLVEFGFDLDGWHRPFKIEAKNKSYLKMALKRKFNYLPTIIFRYSN
jgi:hypothetical protein